MNIHTLLQELGFSEYEARAYAALAGAGESNGYEVAKAAGMPRANVYAVLEKLVERGAAQRIRVGKGVRYAATPPPQLLADLDRRHQETLDATRAALKRLQQPTDSAPAFSLRGAEELLQRARSTIDEARDTLLVAIQPAEAARLAEPLRLARERGVAITTLCLEACAQECGGCQGNIHRLQMAPVDGKRWLLLVSDQSTALLGQLDEPGSQGLLTAQALVIELASAYIRQSLALATLGNELAGRFDGLLSQQARDLFDRLYPDEDFLARIQDLGKPASV